MNKGCIIVLRNPRGAFTPNLSVNVQMVYRVFPGILSEYLALKYGPRVVYMDFGDFLASAYIVYRTTPLAHAWVVLWDFF